MAALTAGGYLRAGALGRVRIYVFVRQSVVELVHFCQRVPENLDCVVLLAVSPEGDSDSEQFARPDEVGLGALEIVRGKRCIHRGKVRPEQSHVVCEIIGREDRVRLVANGGPSQTR